MGVTTRSATVTAEVNAWFAAWKPKLRPPLSVWSRENARLDDGATFVPFPFQDGIADAMSDPAVPQVTVRKSSRIGYSQIVKNLLGYSIDQQPVNIITYFPTVRDAEKFSRKEFRRILSWPSSLQYASTTWVNYRGSDDSLVAVPTNEARVFMAGVPGLFQTYFSPADTFETISEIGIPLYLLQRPEAQTSSRRVFELQSNPLVMCLRPQSLIRLTIG